MNRTRRPANLIGPYAGAQAPATVTDLYVALSTREDGREHICVTDGMPLIAGGGAALAYVREAAARLARSEGTTIRLVHFTGRTVEQEFRP